MVLGLVRRHMMAKKRDSLGKESSSADRSFLAGVIDPRAFEEPGKSFADSETDSQSVRDLKEWEDDQETTPDLFADASDEGQMQASGGHTQQLDGEPPGRDPTIRRR
jgi:hypothetical protein